MNKLTPYTNPNKRRALPASLKYAGVSPHDAPIRRVTITTPVYSNGCIVSLSR